MIPKLDLTNYSLPKLENEAGLRPGTIPGPTLPLESFYPTTRERNPPKFTATRLLPYFSPDEMQSDKFKLMMKFETSGNNYI